MDSEDRLISRLAIADFLAISPNTLDAWRKLYGPQHPNPLPVGRIGKGLVASKSELREWQAAFTRHPEWR